MRTFVLAFVVFLGGCETTMPRLQLEEVPAGQRVTLAQPVTIIETRPPLGLKLEWRLLPGEYVERYRSPAGRMFEGAGQLVEFTPTVGGKTYSVGGFVVLKDRPGAATLYVVRKGQVRTDMGFVGEAIGRAIVGPPGDISLVTDFPLSRIRTGKW